MLPAGQGSIFRADWTLNPESPLQKPLDSGRARHRQVFQAAQDHKQTALQSRAAEGHTVTDTRRRVVRNTASLSSKPWS